VCKLRTMSRNLCVSPCVSSCVASPCSCLRTSLRMAHATRHVADARQLGALLTNELAHNLRKAIRSLRGPQKHYETTSTDYSCACNNRGCVGVVPDTSVELRDALGSTLGYLGGTSGEPVPKVPPRNRLGTTPGTPAQPWGHPPHRPRVHAAHISGNLQNVAISKEQVLRRNETSITQNNRE
jgi:hypothetical protein